MCVIYRQMPPCTQMITSARWFVDINPYACKRKSCACLHRLFTNTYKFIEKSTQKSMHKRRTSCLPILPVCQPVFFLEACCVYMFCLLHTCTEAHLVDTHLIEQHTRTARTERTQKLKKSGAEVEEMLCVRLVEGNARSFGP